MSNDVEELKRRSPVSKTYKQGDVFPADGLIGMGMNVLNQDASGELIITLITDTGTLDIEVPARTAWDDYIIPFKGFTVGGTSTTYKIQVRERQT